MTVQNVDINLIPGGLLPIVNASQFDVQTNAVTFTLFQGSSLFELPDGAGVIVNGQKPDSTAFTYNASYVSGHTVKINISKQMTAVAGDVICELRVSVGNADVGTGNFILRVERSPLDDSVISETVLPLIEQAAEIAATISEYVESVAASAITASDAANTATGAAATATTAAANVEAQYDALEELKADASAAAEAAEDAAEALENITATATTLPAGSSATATYNSSTSTFTFGIPTGATGASGVTTPLAGFFSMWVDSSGNLYAASETDMSDYFSYDSTTGNLYFLTEDGNT